MRAIIALPFFLAFPATGEQVPIIAAFGDSLSSGYQLAPDDGFAPVLQRTLSAQGITVQVVNASISGETSSEGLLRVGWMLKKFRPDVVILEYGANDMLRGLPPQHIYNNLDAIITQLRQAQIKVLLAGMKASPNMGANYAKQFADIYQRLADKHNLIFYPLFLKNVVGNPALNLSDGLHPNAAGVAVIAKNIAPLVIQVLKK